MSRSPFLQLIREHMQVQRYSQSTIHTYVYWIRDYIRFNDLRHPKTLTGSMSLATSLTLPARAMCLQLLRPLR
jgi:hypothetical protein